MAWFLRSWAHATLPNAFFRSISYDKYWGSDTSAPKAWNSALVCHPVPLASDHQRHSVAYAFTYHSHGQAWWPGGRDQYLICTGHGTLPWRIAHRLSVLSLHKIHVNTEAADVPVSLGHRVISSYSIGIKTPLLNIHHVIFTTNTIFSVTSGNVPVGNMLLLT